MQNQKASGKQSILILSNVDWEGLWYQKQEIACRFAQEGHSVWYINRTLQRWPRWHHLKSRIRLRRVHDEGRSSNGAIRILSPLWLPPVPAFRLVNRWLIRRSLAKAGIPSGGWLVTYVPTQNTLDVVTLVKPNRLAYVCVHNYDAAPVVRDLLRAERELCHQADLILADSAFNFRRLERLAPGRTVYKLPPGVDALPFSQAYRGDEAIRRQNMVYFGSIGPHLDLLLYGEMARHLKVTFIGTISSDLREPIPDGIELRPAVVHNRLAEALVDADMLALFYRPTAYMDGVLPAKFFECLATQKPILVSGLAEATNFANEIYDVGGSAPRTLEAIRNLPQYETSERLQFRRRVAEEADWAVRFAAFRDLLNSEFRS